MHSALIEFIFMSARSSVCLFPVLVPLPFAAFNSLRYLWGEKRFCMIIKGIMAILQVILMISDNHKL